MTDSLAAVTLVSGSIRLLGMGVAAGVAAAVVALAYRWYSRTQIPEGLAVLIGLTIVAIEVNTSAAFTQVVGGRAGLFELEAAAWNLGVFLTAALAAVAGRRVGDRIAGEVTAVAGTDELERGVSDLVKSVGRVITVELPDDIEDINAYEPVPQATKDTLAGKTIVFPRRLTLDELHDRLIQRLKDDYGVGHVAVDLTDAGEVEYLAVGSRAAGLGPTLPPGTAATAVRADPAFSASPGDTVQVWRPGEDPTRVATGELRGTADDVVTLALDEPDADALDPFVRYRLVTLPAESRPDREFASLLRSADETMAAITVGPGSDLDGAAIGDLDVTVVAVRAPDDEVEAIPPRQRTLAPEEVVYAIARPERLRRLEATASPDGTRAEPSS